MYRANRNDVGLPRWWETPRSNWTLPSRARTSRSETAEAAEARHICRLPCTSESFYSDQYEPFGWGLALSAVFSGTRDERSPLSALRDHESTILRHVCSYLSNQWARHVMMTIPASCVGNMRGKAIGRFPKGREYPAWCSREWVSELPLTSSGPQGFVSFATCGQLEFPEPAGRNVNMMPFIFGDEYSLPDELRCYHDLIEKCPYMQEEVGKVGYLTVQESFVHGGHAQRREGLHIEAPGTIFTDDNGPAFTPGVEHQWGQGVFFGPDHYHGGIYMASSVADTSEVWDALVDKSVKGIVDNHGGCEHLRKLIGPGTKLKAGELIWMTDCTPHEAISQSEPGHRTFFRVVTSRISHWFAQHSTTNPNVPLPDNVVIVGRNKFEY